MKSDIADLDLERLMGAAKSLKATPAKDEGPEETPRLSDLIADAERDVATQWSSDESSRLSARRWAQRVLGPDAREPAVEALAMRRALSRAVESAMASFPQTCAAANVHGPGVELVARQGQGLVVAFIHTCLTSAMAYALPSRTGRTIFVPDGLEATGPRPGGATASSDAVTRLQWHGEQAGLRWVAPDRRLEVMAGLVEQGQACALAVDAFGHGRGELLGRPVSTSRGAAALAHLTQAPVVFVNGYRQGSHFSVRVAAPLDPASLGSVPAIHRSLLQMADERLRRDPAQMLVRFPAVDLVDAYFRRRELERRMRALDHRVTEAEAAGRLAEEAVAAARTDEDRARAALRHRHAAHRLKDARDELKAYRGEVKAIKIAMRR